MKFAIKESSIKGGSNPRFLNVSSNRTFHVTLEKFYDESFTRIYSLRA